MYPVNCAQKIQPKDDENSSLSRHKKSTRNNKISTHNLGQLKHQLEQKKLCLNFFTSMRRKKKLCIFLTFHAFRSLKLTMVRQFLRFLNQEFEQRMLSVKC